MFNLTNRLNPKQYLQSYGARAGQPLPAFLQIVQAGRPASSSFPYASRFSYNTCSLVGPTTKGEQVSAENGFKLRSDLVIEPVEENGTLYYVIKDLCTERFFRIKPLEYFLISQFDGRTGLAEIRRRASKEKKVLISDDVLTRFAAKFRDLGASCRRRLEGQD